MFKVLITGPESSGKSFLSKALANHFNGIMVPEFSRQYLESRSSYDESNLLEIAKGQYELEEKGVGQNPDYLFCDTGQEVIMIWSSYKFQNIHPLINEMHSKSCYDLILLCKPNIAWEPDVLRENPNDRNRLFELYEGLLKPSIKKVRVIDAVEGERVQQAIDFIVSANQ